MPDFHPIAVVDDHTLFRKGLISLINVFPNFQVMLEASNGKEFIERIDPHNLPEIVLMDISMPEMDGYATCEWLKSHYPKIKVLALSTMDAETAIIKMIRSGAKGYIVKDADLSELKLAFSELLSIGFFYNELVSRKVIHSINKIVEDNDEVAALQKLSENELAFLRLSCSEKTYAEIATEMFKSEKTIDGYRAELFKKLNVSSRVGMVMYAIKNGIVQL
ncbi:MAG: response regulator transcription factor [Sediminibacterium sp.]|nr:response regulator transcription factor [Sediminibacterium sp.]